MDSSEEIFAYVYLLLALSKMICTFHNSYAITTIMSSDQLCFLSLVEIFYANVSAIFKIHWEINAIFISWFYKVYLLVPT